MAKAKTGIVSSECTDRIVDFCTPISFVNQTFAGLVPAMIHAADIVGAGISDDGNRPIIFRNQIGRSISLSIAVFRFVRNVYPTMVTYLLTRLYKDIYVLDYYLLEIELKTEITDSRRFLFSISRSWGN